MNTNDLPPAAKLAALIEAGRAANPDVQHGRTRVFDDEDGLRRACALGFAVLGAGCKFRSYMFTLEAAEHVGISSTLASRVYVMNDGGASLEAICQSLREGELANAPA